MYLTCFKIRIDHDAYRRSRFDKGLAYFSRLKNERRFMSAINVSEGTVLQVEDAKKDLCIIKTLQECRDYIFRNSLKLGPNGTPLFSARHFISEIDKHIEQLVEWFGEKKE